MANPFDPKNQITKNPQQTRANNPHTILGHLKKPKGLKPLPTKLKSPPKVPPPPKMNTLQKIGASLVPEPRPPKIPWFMRYPYRPVLSALSLSKKSLEAGVVGSVKAKRRAQELAWKIRNARG